MSHPDDPHILVVDDDRRIRELLGRYLGQHDFNVTEAGNAAVARQLIELFEFDAIVLDIMMPGEDGMQLTQSLKDTHFETPILLLTAKGEAESRIAGFEAGADDYLAKPFEPRELVLRLQSILRRANKMPQRSEIKVKFCGWSFNAERNLLEKGTDTQPLTKAEATLLSILSKKPGTAYSRQELAQMTGQTGQERTIDVQVTRLRRKIEPDPKKPRFLQTVRGEGYVLFIDEEVA
jgi:two-component system phosphate regulon response regulator OmpR